MTLVKIRANGGNVGDFRSMVGDDHLERSLLDAAINHLDFAFREAFSESLLKLQFASRGCVVWSPQWLDVSQRNLSTLMSWGLVRVFGVRPVLDIPLDFDETIVVEQDPVVKTLGGFDTLRAINDHLRPVVKVKRMKKWKRLTISFVEVCLPVSIFPWRDVSPEHCDCLACALIPQSGVIPAFYCGVCGKIYWCSCMSRAVQKLLNRKNYDREPIRRLTEQAERRDDICHLCRGVPVTSVGKSSEGGISALMNRYFAYRYVAAIENDWNWRAGENDLRVRLGVPKIGEGWIGEAMLLSRVIALLPDEEIIHQGSPDWLGRQRFDIWLPRLKVAIEYNGEQHYAPVSAFGGESGFAATRMRDAQKRQLCAENDVRLIEVAYHESITDAQLLQKIMGHSFR